MSVSVGIGLAFVAMLCWGIGDFFDSEIHQKVGLVVAIAAAITLAALTV